MPKQEVREMRQAQRESRVREPFARAFLAQPESSIGERIAAGMRAHARQAEICFGARSLLPTVGRYPVDGFCSYSYGSGITVDEARYAEIMKRYPEEAGELAALREAMREHETRGQWLGRCEAEDLRLVEAMACWGGGWGGHANPDYERWLHEGILGLRERVRAGLAAHPERAAFYQGCEGALEALAVLGQRIREAALLEAAAEADPERRRELGRMAEAFSRIPLEPAWDMHSAVLMLWMFYTFDGVDSPGRFDQFMIDYWRAGPEAERWAMLDRFLEGMHEVRGWNLCLSGSDENGADQTNELSYAVLERVTELGYNTPNLTLRVHPGTPDALWDRAIRCLGTGIGLPAIYNDEVVCPALEAIGIPPHDSHDYCLNGCNQIDIMGKSHMGLEDGEVNLGKVLELTLHRGRDQMAGGLQLVPDFGDPCACGNFADFLALYYRCLKHVTDVSLRLAWASQEAYAETAPNPLRSCVIQGCLEKGLDYKAGGPLYGHGQVLAEGIADTADSLHAIRVLVYETGRWRMDELVRALAADFVGWERLHADFSRCDKFGNDIEAVDTLCAAVVDHWFRYLKTRQTCRGGVYTGGCSPFNRAANNGRATGALPNGRRAGEATYADSIAATPGRDRLGPTAALGSMMRYDQVQAGSGFVAQLKFGGRIFARESGRRTFRQLAETYFANGGQQLSVNVLDRETLLAAQADPDAHRSLIVRVGGYSDYFCNLSPDLQQNVIDRSEFVL